MNLSFYIAQRYLIAKKSHNAINVISAISVVGVAIGTMALIVVLSVFNGFEGLVKSLFNAFDPDLKITLTKGKTFVPQDSIFDKIKTMEKVLHYSQVLEENALIQYNKKQYIATIKGVDESFKQITGIDTMIIDGSFLLQKHTTPFAVVGSYIAHTLSVGIHLIDPLKIYVPKRTHTITQDPRDAFTKQNIHPSGIFQIQQDFDSKYIIVPLSFARNLLQYTNEISAVELKLDPTLSPTQQQKIQSSIQTILGKEFDVKNRYQQQALLYRIMKSEKWAIFFILSFILVIASFNLIGSLTMLIIDKKKDIAILQSLGATKKLIHNIFLIEGWFISWIGAIIGLILGAFICWLQITFCLVEFPNTSLLSCYPVEMKLYDFVLVSISVGIIGLFAAWYPVKILIKTHITL